MPFFNINNCLTSGGHTCNKLLCQFKWQRFPPIVKDILKLLYIVHLLSSLASTSLDGPPKMLYWVQIKTLTWPVFKAFDLMSLFVSLG